MKEIKVVAAIIKLDDKILCVQRDESKYPYISRKYEFPGGKIEDHETQKNAVVREIKEELDLDIEVQSYFMTVNHTYPDFKIEMSSFICTCQDQHLVLKEHIDSKWLSVEELKDLNWAAADIPIVEKLIQST